MVAEANDGGKALTAAIESRPHVAIVDFSMPRMTGVEVARRIKEYPLQTEVLIFTVHNSGLLAQQAFEAGARAFLVKSDANRLLLWPSTHFWRTSDSVPKAALNGIREWRGPGGDADRNHRLTPREQLVVKLVAEGYSNKGISAILNSASRP